MKHYLLFAGSNYYPSGGMNDFQGDFVSVDACKNCLLGEKLSQSFDWWHVVDVGTGKIVASSINNRPQPYEPEQSEP